VSATFRAMGCEVIVAGGSRGAHAAIERLFEERESLFSRFRAESELCRVNESPSPIVAASSEFLRALGAALDAARATDGVVDPTLGAAIVAAGYDDDLAELPADGPLAPEPPPADWRRIRVGKRLLVRPPGAVLDLNGVVKAMAVDDAVALLDAPGHVSAGGDVAVRGEPVLVGVPGGDMVLLQEGGLATSGTATRSWRRGGRPQHHLIDPETRRPSRSPWSFVTAAGRDCLAADVAAKAGFLLGPAGPAWLDDRGVAARFVAGDAIVCNHCWQRSVVHEGVRS